MLTTARMEVPSGLTIVALLVIVLISVACAQKLHFDKYQVLRITPKCEEDLKVLHNLQYSSLGEKLDFWREPSQVNRSVDMMVSPALQKEVWRAFDKEKIDVAVMIPNVQILIDEEEKHLHPTRFDYNKYNTYEMIQEWITEIADKYQTASEGSLRKSYEGRNIGYLKISTGGSKKAVVLQGGIHAAEWISPATVIYLAKNLLEGGSEAKRLLKKFDFYIIPVLNVDGYVYSWTKQKNRFWRKTRKPNPGSFCVGTDPNRNFVTGWGGKGSSDRPCSLNFHGLFPFSEPEVRAVRDLVDSLGGYNGVAMYIDYHSYGQELVTPYGFTDTKPANYDVVYAGAQAACEALKSVNGTDYTYGSVIKVIYAASGLSIDDMYAGQGVQFSYTFEGRDTGKYGFLLPQPYIQPSGEENWAAFTALCNFVYDHINKV